MFSQVADVCTTKSTFQQTYSYSCLLKYYYYYYLFILYSEFSDPIHLTAYSLRTASGGYI